MKKLLIVTVLFVLFAHPVFAENDAKALSLSDAIYADLAVRHNLDNVSVYYADGDAENDIKINEGRHWIPASTVKTFAAMYAYKLFEEGKLRPFTTVTIEPKNAVPTELVTEELPTLEEGSSVPLARLIRQMIIQSDNTAFNVLLDVLGRENITGYIQSLGLIHSRVGSKLNLDTSQEQYEFDVPGYGINTTTAEDYAKAFDLIKNQKISGANELFSVLKDQKINTMIPLYLPKGVTCAHKTGDLDPLYHDGGICQDQKQSYVLTIFTNAGDPKLLGHLSQIVYTKDYNLVGESLEKKPLGQAPVEDVPIDPLVMNTEQGHAVLGAATVDFPTPIITAADLGVESNDLSFVANDKDLPRVFIPADSPWHVLIDGLYSAQRAYAFRRSARREIDFAAARLSIAEAKDLSKRGKSEAAQAVLRKVQPTLSAATKDTSILRDASVQNAVAQISETRFAVLADALQQTKGEARIALLKDIANQAKETVLKVQPYIPDATNASNPTQRPLIGEVTHTTSAEVKVKTAGGQEVTIPINQNFVVVKDKKSSTSSLANLTTGTTVALIGSTTNNTFSPTLVLANIPRELAAPVPVTVAKVDTKRNTMVVVENGVYTQVNINKNTSIKGADTNIPLKEIKPGDIVVVHGEPLTPRVPSKPSAVPSPTGSATLRPIPTGSGSDTPGTKQPVTPIPTKTSGPTTGSPATPSVSSSLPQLQPVQKKPSSAAPQTIPPATPQTPSKPNVVESTTIRLIEKKENVEKPKPQSSKATPAAPVKNTEVKKK